MSEPIDKQIVDAVLDVLHSRKGFDWWWEGEIGAANRADIKRKARTKVRAIIRDTTGGDE